MNKLVETIEAIVGEYLPNANIYELLYRHNCLYLLSECVDQQYQRKAKIDIAVNRIYASEYYNNCRALFEDFNDHNIDYAVIKGATLSKTIFGDICFRTSSDIDILIDTNNIDLIKHILISKGFVQGKFDGTKIAIFSREELVFYSSMTHQLAPFIKKNNNTLCPFINIDLNSSIIWSQCDECVDMGFVLKHSQFDEINGVAFKKLNKEMEFISLCLHHYKDMNSVYMLYESKLKLSLFLEIYYFIVNQRPQLTQLKEIAVHLKVDKYIYYCLFYTNMIFKNPELDIYLKSFYSETAEKLLNTYGLHKNEIKTWDISFYERLFAYDLKRYIFEHASEQERKSILYNKKYL